MGYGNEYGVYGDQNDVVGTSGEGGPGLDEIIGALLNPGSQGASMVLQDPNVRAALAARVAARQPILRRQAPTQWRKWFTGIGPLYIAAGATGTFTIAPQLLFKVKKIVMTDVSTGTGVPAGYASNVTGITIGQQSQMPNNTVVPVWSFGISAQENTVDFDTCQGAYSMTFTFSATTACTISGTLYGLCVKAS